MSKHPPLSPHDLPDWPVGDPCASLPDDIARVWIWSIDGPEGASLPLLSADEIQRAQRFHFEQDRRHFINARAGLRRLLAGAIGTMPGEIGFTYHGLGKPSLAGGGRLGFNLSHSAGVAAAVLGHGVNLGIDVEAIRLTRWSEGIAQRYFSPGEVAQLSALPRDQQDAGFFRFWTNKEAVVKLLGSGLGFPLPSFATPLNPAAGEMVPLPADNPLGLSACWVQSLEAGSRLRLSVAADRPLRVELCSLPF